MAFSHTVGGTTFTEANFEGNAYANESSGFPNAIEKMVEHVANAYRGTSTTSNAVGTGSKTWTVTNSNSQIPAFAVGMPVRVARTSAPTTTFMQGEVTAFTAATGSTTVNVSSSLGSGTHTDWTITIGGHQTTAAASPLAIADGGTGAGTAGAALTALGGATDGANSDITSLTGLTTPLTVAQGGMGAATHTLNNVIVGAGTSAVTSVAPGSSGNVLTSNGSTWSSAAGKIVDVKYVTATTYSSTTLSSWVDCTNMTLDHTMAASGNYLIVSAVGSMGSYTSNTTTQRRPWVRLVRDTAEIAVQSFNNITDSGGANIMHNWSGAITAVTAPGDTSSHTYKLQIKNQSSGGNENVVWNNAISATSTGVITILEYTP